MADLTKNPGTWASQGPPDTATPLQPGVDEVRAIHQNYPIQAIIAIQAILGNSQQLVGNAVDLMTRLSALLDADGKMRGLSVSNKAIFPGTVSEGMTGATAFAPGELVRMDDALDRLIGTGLTQRPGSSGHVVTEESASTLTNKTLASPQLNTPTLAVPTIADFSNATHQHDSANGGGKLRQSAVNLNANSFQASFSLGSLVHTFRVAEPIIGGFSVSMPGDATGIVTMTQAGSSTQVGVEYTLTVATPGSTTSGLATVGWNEWAP